MVHSREFFVFRKLSERSGIDLTETLLDYLAAGDDALRQTALLQDYISKLKLAKGLQSGLIFMWSRRLLKSDADLHERLSTKLAKGDFSGDPSTYPAYLSEKFLQDKDFKSTTSMAGLLQIEDRSVAVLDHIIGLVRKGGPAPFGKHDLFQEAALDTTLQRALPDAQADAALTRGDVYRVAVSRRGLRSFIGRMFGRIPFRIHPSVADRIHPVFFDQVQHLLHLPSRTRRIIFVSPEIQSLRKLVDDDRIQDSILVGVPNPFLTNAAKIFVFWTMMPEEKAAFLGDVEARLGHARVAALESEVEELLFEFTSFKLQFQVHPQRFVMGPDGAQVDVLDNQRPPMDYRTLWAVMSKDSEEPENPNAGIEKRWNPMRPFQRGPKVRQVLRSAA